MKAALQQNMKSIFTINCSVKVSVLQQFTLRLCSLTYKGVIQTFKISLVFRFHGNPVNHDDPSLTYSV